jgi:hypothetical protein
VLIPQWVFNKDDIRFKAKLAGKRGRGWRRVPLEGLISGPLGIGA